jgi:hypothetical protein
MSFVLYIIISLTQLEVASRGRGEIPSCCFKAKGVDTTSETSHTANGISRKVKKHVPGKPIRRMGNHQSSLCRQSAPLVTSKRFAVTLSRSVAIRKRCPKL